MSRVVVVVDRREGLGNSLDSNFYLIFLQHARRPSFRFLFPWRVVVNIGAIAQLRNKQCVTGIIYLFF